MKTLVRLSRLVAPLFPIMLLAVVFGTLGNLCAIGIPLLGTLALFSKFNALFLPFAGLLRGVFHYAEQYCNHFIAFTLLARIRKIVFAKLRALGPAKLETKEKGNLISLITNDIEALEVFYAHTISPVCIAFLTCAVIFVFIAHYHWTLALVALAFYVLVGVGIPLLISRHAVESGAKYRAQFAKLNSLILDALRGLEQSILYGNGAKKLQQIKDESDILSAHQKRTAKFEGMTALLTGILVSCGALCMLLVALVLYKTNRISLDALIICTVAMFSSFGPVIAVANLGTGLNQTIACGKRVLSLLDEKPLVEEVQNGKEIAFTGAAAKRVTFCYPAGDAALFDVSMSFPKGKIIGIQGKSGSGKSTLLKLFLRFWKADAGNVEISDVNVNNIDSHCRKSLESYVSQETVLFHDTIANNIRIAKLDASDEEIKAACRKAMLDEFIQTLPDGYETQVAELGDNFSGGERQRLGLARAFLHDGDFMLLDEPTSNLDSWNEQKIMDAVKAGSAGKTVVIVSHRDSTFEHADAMYRLMKRRGQSI